jgi:hypothetical protein
MVGLTVTRPVASTASLRSTVSDISLATLQEPGMPHRMRLFLPGAACIACPPRDHISEHLTPSARKTRILLLWCYETQTCRYSRSRHISGRHSAPLSLGSRGARDRVSTSLQGWSKCWGHHGGLVHETRSSWGRTSPGRRCASGTVAGCGRCPALPSGMHFMSAHDFDVEKYLLHVPSVA